MTSMKRSVVVYGTAQCVRCKVTVRQLRRGGVGVEVVDLDEVPAARSIVEAMDFTQLPVVAAGERWWQGLELDLIKETVTRYGVAPTTAAR